MKFTNVSGEHLDFPSLNVFGVAPGDEFEATGDDAKNLQASPLVERSDKPKTKTEETSA